MSSPKFERSSYAFGARGRLPKVTMKVTRRTTLRGASFLLWNLSKSFATSLTMI
jgi:hypothetical protein